MYTKIKTKATRMEKSSNMPSWYGKNPGHLYTSNVSKGSGLWFEFRDREELIEVTRTLWDISPKIRSSLYAFDDTFTIVGDNRIYLASDCYWDDELEAYYPHTDKEVEVSIRDLFWFLVKANYSCSTEGFTLEDKLNLN